MNFAELVKEYASHPVNVITLTAVFGEDTPIQDMVLLRKLRKHSSAGNLRSMAKYLAGYMSHFPGPLPNEAGLLAKRAQLLRSATYGIGYPHADGRHHWFEVKTQAPTAVRIAFIPHSTMSTYLDVREDATLKALVKATGAQSAEYHRAPICGDRKGCDCAPCKQFHHVVVTNPTMCLDDIRSKYGNSFAQGEYTWRL